MKSETVNNQELNKLAAICGAPLLQSGYWAGFQESLGKQVFNLVVKSAGQPAVFGALIKQPLPLGRNYFYAPRGPVAVSSDRASLDYWWRQATALARRHKAVFIRSEPGQADDLAGQKARRTADIQPSRTLLLDLAKGGDQLLSEMHQKTRYNIRLAHRKGVRVRQCRTGSGCKDLPFDRVWRLMTETGSRNEFRLHQKDYYKKMLELEPVSLMAAVYKDELLAVGIFSFFNDQAVYLHGASSSRRRNLMAPHALQWQAISRAERLGCRTYDFYGIDESKWPGVTRFKTGFGGFVKEYPGTFDIVINQPYYYLYKAGRKILNKR